MVYIKLENVSLNLPVQQSISSLGKELLTGKFKRQKKTSIHAISHFELYLKEGDTLGLVGLNGAGKTTLLRLMAGIYTPSSGKISHKGKITCVLGTGFGMSDDSTGYENIFSNGLYLGISLSEMRKKIDEIIDFSGLEEFINYPLRTYSAGMKARLSFAIATCYQPEILLIDEGIGAGDASFMKKAESRLSSFMRNSSMLVLASHSNSLITQFCENSLFLERGVLKAHGKSEEVLQQYSASIGN